MAKDPKEAILTPVEIEHQTFDSQSFGGYNTHQVDDFLRKVVISFEKILEENARLRERIEYLNEKLCHYHTLEGSLKEAYLAAQAAAREYITVKRKEADELVTEAAKESQALVKKAGEEKERLEREITELTDTRGKIQFDEFKTLAKACLEVLEERKKKMYNDP